jgi:tRNA uridine 5-carboxymethylaminomethyl modification enzyme
MLTSRAEHRLLLRADNADDRLADRAYELGLIGSDRLLAVRAERHARQRLLSLLESSRLSPNNATTDLLAFHALPPVTRSMTALDYARRPDVDMRSLIGALAEIQPQFVTFHSLDATAVRSAAVDARYAGYVEKEHQQIERTRRMEHTTIPASFDYDAVPGFRNEARERLRAIRPTTVGQAGRIAGVTPADVAVLLVHVRRSTSSPSAHAREPVDSAASRLE